MEEVLLKLDYIQGSGIFSTNNMINHIGHQIFEHTVEFCKDETRVCGCNYSTLLIININLIVNINY